MSTAELTKQRDELLLALRQAGEVIGAIARIDPRTVSAESCKAVAQRWVHAQHGAAAALAGGALALPPGTSECPQCEGKGVIYRCVICLSDEPGGGTCGSSDPRALCNAMRTARDEPATAPHQLRPIHRNAGHRSKSRGPHSVVPGDRPCDGGRPS